MSGSLEDLFREKVEIYLVFKSFLGSEITPEMKSFFKFLEWGNFDFFYLSLHVLLLFHFQQDASIQSNLDLHHFLQHFYSPSTQLIPCQKKKLCQRIRRTALQQNVSLVNVKLCLYLYLVVILIYYRPTFSSLKNQPLDLLCKSNDWFLYEWNIDQHTFLGNTA